MRWFSWQKSRLSLSFIRVFGGDEFIYPHMNREWPLLYFNNISWSAAPYGMYTLTIHMDGLVSSISRATTLSEPSRVSLYC